ncbi:hypothetical protein CDAR_24531 [Caerostris darwini]|uniref:Uncharacterized protein n=1 Tax=Caerostris darwini TaxID=1538125 RepID=A0AAV4SE60_9ARAC|nr:hypothetical protein CDAR_24531 [Caerostris darwini]
MTDLSNLMEFISLFLFEANRFSADRICRIRISPTSVISSHNVHLACLFLSPIAVWRGSAALHESRSAEVFGGSFYFMASKVFGTGRKNEECLGCRW